MVGLHDVARKRAGQFSLGMGQRLGIATALLGDPATLLLDEPVNGLDPEGIHWIRNLLKSLAAEGRTVFVSSHLMTEMALTADHGTNRDPLESGAFQIDTASFEGQLVQHFDDNDNVPLIVKDRTTELWLNEAELAQNGFTLDQVSSFIMGLTQAQTVKSGRAPQPGHENDTVFSGALPSSMLSQLPCLPEARNSS